VRLDSAGEPNRWGRQYQIDEEEQKEKEKK
jgi:hypothetical protein